MASPVVAYTAVGNWLLGTAGMVVGMIHVGGLTRLTSSGLSMTSWSPLGSKPPLSEKEWRTEFERYQQFPEFQQRQSMTLSDFQYIYWWEYGHRMLGRTIGLVYLFPWMYFTARGRIPAGFQPRLAFLAGMGATQGFVGWWMVKSGLGDDRRDDSSEIKVKPLRLATHLSMAFATYGTLVWTAWDIYALGSTTQAATVLPSKALHHAKRLRIGGIAVTSLTAITVVSGALVAGNDAGRAYNTWPKMMPDSWLPSEWYQQSHNTYQTFKDGWTRDAGVVQFNHRLLGQTTGALAIGLVVLARPNSLSSMPKVRNGIMAIGTAATAQVVLGIGTLLNYVPIGLAAVHQLGSVVVLTSGLYLVHAARHIATAPVARTGGARALTAAVAPKA